ncbi:MAG: hypothetical protein ACJA2S_002043 [Cyclobacteriaceae bacterium]|jgi:uncharacterized protein (DUF2141 family)
MKKILLLSIGLLLTSVAFSKPTNDSHSLTVVIKNFKNTNGKAQITHFSSDEKFLKEGETITVDIENKDEITVVFEGIMSGKIAVSVIHDENENGDLDTGIFGIPTEDYGFSNDAKGNFGPPSFEDCIIEITGDKTVIININ